MIYKLKQNRVSRTYRGGSKIERFTGEQLKENDAYYPEDWLASVTTALNNNGLTEGLGQTTDKKFIKDIIGDDIFPILVKLLDSDERLVIQVHPTVEYAKKYLNSNFGKTECWFFMDCSKDACAYLGFKKGITKERWKEAIKNQNNDELLSMLWRIPVKNGDFVFVDGGVPHAIGSGCFMIELQEPSDLMVVAEHYTVSGRKISDFRLDMGLGLDTSLDMYDYTGYSFDEIKQKYCSHPNLKENQVCEILGKNLTNKFTMNCMRANSVLELKHKYAVAVVISGDGKMCNIPAKEGDRFFISENKKLETFGTTDFKVIVCE